MSDTNVSLTQEVIYSKCKNCKKLERWSRLRKAMLTFFTLLIVPTCQSMPSEVSITYIQHQNIQVTHNVSEQANQSK